MNPVNALLAVAETERVTIWDILAVAPIDSPQRVAERPLAVAIDPQERWCALGEPNGDRQLRPRDRSDGPG